MMSGRKKRKIFNKKRSHLNHSLRWFSGISLGIVGILFISLVNQGTQDLLSVLGLVTPSHSLAPQESWDEYQDYFENYSTKDLSPTFLAALAQTESSGSFFLAPKWTFSLKRGPFQILKPESTAFGLMQLTGPQFAQSKNFCIQEQNPERTGKWYHVDGCWFNSMSTRLSPANSVEHTSAFLQASVNHHIHGEGRQLVKERIEIYSALLHHCGITDGLAWLEGDQSENVPPSCRGKSAKNYLDRLYKNKRVFDTLRSESELARK
jgi:hypothetical protein